MTKNIFCLLSVKFLLKILFLYITVKLDLDIDRKYTNFYLKNPQNISVDQKITELSPFLFHYELFMEPKRFSFNIKWSKLLLTSIIKISAHKKTESKGFGRQGSDKQRTQDDEDLLFKNWIDWKRFSEVKKSKI